MEHVESSNQPPTPGIGSHITIGLNTTSRHLEAFIKPDQDLTNTAPLAAVFLTQSPLALQYTHLPVLTALAASSHREISAPRLIPLDKSAEQRLSRALGIRRVSVIGVLQDAPGARPLIDYVREHVGAVEVPWVTETTEGKFLGTKIEAD
jgi:ribonuclease P/MRP protein subunit POP3